MKTRTLPKRLRTGDSRWFIDRMKGLAEPAPLAESCGSAQSHDRKGVVSVQSPNPAKADSHPGLMIFRIGFSGWNVKGNSCCTGIVSMAALSLASPIPDIKGHVSVLLLIPASAGLLAPPVDPARAGLTASPSRMLAPWIASHGGQTNNLNIPPTGVFESSCSADLI